MSDLRAELRASFTRRGMTPPKKLYKPEQPPYKRPKRKRFKHKSRGNPRSIRKCVQCGERKDTREQGEIFVCFGCRKKRGGRCQVCCGSLDARHPNAKYCEPCALQKQRESKRAIARRRAAA